MHAHDTNGIKMVLPVPAETLLNLPQVEPGVRIKPLLRQLLQDVALEEQALFGQVHLRF
ncbi:hypothetical protein MOOR_28380 [Moorella thermoacetica]|uniref:Uncharacterized protein n=1 Tax=Neomoorella thermoacetica TaxID=1525 RepID=A0A1J5JSM3_NEOTH|nr:hypothetical protein MOOR_28380 [Moorella thermoacetica]